MSTLLDFIYHTKGWEYIIAISFLVVFIVLWKMLNRERPEEPVVEAAAQNAPAKASQGRMFNLVATAGGTLAIAVALVALVSSHSNTNVQIMGQTVTVAPPTTTTVITTTPGRQTATPVTTTTAPTAPETTAPATPAATSTPAATTAPATTAPATTATATGPKPIPVAGHKGMTTCKMCHANGLGPKYPANPDHNAYPDTLAFCQACHKAQ